MTLVTLMYQFDSLKRPGHSTRICNKLKMPIQNGPHTLRLSGPSGRQKASGVVPLACCETVFVRSDPDWSCASSCRATSSLPIQLPLLVSTGGRSRSELASHAFAQKSRRRLSNLFLWDGPMELPTPEMENGNHSRMSMIRDRGVAFCPPDSRSFSHDHRKPFTADWPLHRMPPKSAHISKWIGGRARFWRILQLNFASIWRGTHEKTRSLPRHSVGRPCGHCVFSLKNS